MSDFVINKFSTSNGPDRYITVKTYSPDDSLYITKALKSPDCKVYLFDSGRISIQGDPTIAEVNTAQKVFPNPMFVGQDNSRETLSNMVKQPDTTYNYIFSKPLGKYILYIKTPNNVQLKYNPVPRPELTNILTKDNYKSYNDILYNICYDTKMNDPICACMAGNNTPNDPRERELCMVDMLGSKQLKEKIKAIDTPTYNTLLSTCDCTNPNCKDLNHPYAKAVRLAYTNKSTCPEAIQVVVCNTNVSAGQSLSSQNINLSQKCGATQATSEIPSSTASTGAGTGPTGPTGPTGTGNGTGTTGATGAQTPPPSRTRDQTPAAEPSFFDKYKTWIIASVIILLLLIGVGLYFSKSNAPQAYAYGGGGYGGGYARPYSMRVRKSSRR